MNISKFALSIGAAGLLAASLVAPASAAPVLTNTAAVKSASDMQPTQVRWRRGGAVAAGVGVGLLAGAAIASQPRYYGDSYYEPGYGAGYGYEPGYDYSYNARSYGGTAQPHTWYQGRVDTFGSDSLN